MKKNTKRVRSSSLFEDIRKLLKFISSRRKWQLLSLFILMIVSALSEMVSLGAIFPFLEALSNPDQILGSSRWSSIISILEIETQSDLVYGLAFLFIATVIIANGLRLLTLNAKVRLSAAVGADLSCQIYGKTLRQPYGFHLQHNSSDLTETITGDMQRLTSAILNPLLTLLTNALLATSLMGALIVIDGRMAVAAATIFGGSYFIIYQARKKILKRNSKIIATAGQYKIKAVQEGLGGIRDILIAHKQDYFQRKFQQSESALKRAQATNNLISQTPKFLMEAITMSAIAVLALILGQDGDFSKAVPVLGSLTLGAKRLLPTLQEFFTCVARIQGTRASLDRILIALQRPIDPLFALPAPSAPLALKRELCLENIWFRYNNEDAWVLKDLNLRIPAKTSVAFVGSTGSGKTTTADLIMGLLLPQKGAIRVDGHVLQEESLRRWQMGIAHVPQNIFLMDASIAENIAFGVPKKQINFDQLNKVARMAQIDEFI